MGCRSEAVTASRLTRRNPQIHLAQILRCSDRGAHQAPRSQLNASIKQRANQKCQITVDYKEEKGRREDLEITWSDDDKKIDER